VSNDVNADLNPRSISQRRQSARSEASAGYEQRRQRLLEAAAAVFNEKGFGATSINDIAARLGSDRASVYYYYGSKQEIYLDLIRRAVEQIVVTAETLAAENGPATVRLRHLFEATLDGYERHYPYLHIFIQEDVRRFSPEDGPGNVELETWGTRFEKAFATVIKDGIERGEFRSSLDPQLAMLAMLGTINWSHRWFSPGERFSGEELGTGFVDIFLQGIRAPRSRSSRPGAAAAPAKRQSSRRKAKPTG
jgi:TetR/AcrR family transcriptional regulator, cholesterol catabolism regulator